jgi:hypothetical protein
MKRYDEGLEILDKCLEKRMYHLGSRKRRALLLEKVKYMLIS